MAGAPPILGPIVQQTFNLTLDIHDNLHRLKREGKISSIAEFVRQMLEIGIKHFDKE